MSDFLQVDWKSMFVPSVSLVEIVIRGTFMYLGMFMLLRVFRRQAGALGIADLLVVVIIADAAQNGMTGDAKSVTEAMLLIVTIVLWDYILDFLAYRCAFLQKVIEPKDLLLISEGKLIRANLHKEMISYEELRSQLRQQGIEKVSDVKECRLESNGHFSIVKKKTD